MHVTGELPAAGRVEGIVVELPDTRTDERSAPAAWVADAWDRHARDVLAYATSVAGSADAGRDVAQETFARLCAQDERTVAPHLKAWLLRVARNLAIDHRRRRGRMNALGDEHRGSLKDGAPSPVDQLGQADSAARALKLMTALPENQREALRLRFQNGLSYREIAGVTNQPIGTVSFLIHAGLKTLRERMEERSRG
jgi:RNA polymerase sigma-70 factor (ECF subfamily)